MKIKLSKSQWEEMGKKAGWNPDFNVEDLMREITNQIKIMEFAEVDKMLQNYKNKINNVLTQINQLKGE